MSRRRFLKSAALAACTPLVTTAADSVSRSTAKLQIGIAGYSFLHYRKDPQKAITLLKDLAIDQITLKDFHLPLDATPTELKTILSTFSKEGIRIYGLGVIYMSDEAGVERGFRYAANAGVDMIVGSPAPALLPLVEKKVKETNIRIAIHNHGPEDKHYPDIDTIFQHIKSLDARIGICLDIGHSFRCGHRPDQMLRQFGSRVIDMHIKDVTVQQPDGQSTIPGRGILPIRDVFHVAQQIGFNGVLSLEYELPGDPAVGIAESVGYLRGLSRALA